MTEQSEEQKTAEVSPDNAESVVRAFVFSSNSGTGESRQLDDSDVWQNLQGEIIKPPYDPALWASLLEDNTRLCRSITAYARMTVGLGYSFAPKIDMSKANQGQKKEVEIQQQRAERLFGSPNTEYPFPSLMYRVMVDEEATGNGYVEVSRSRMGKPAALWHCPSHTIRVRNDGGFVQIRANKKKYFKNYGDSRSLDSDTGKYFEVDSPEGQKLPLNRRGNEIIHFRVYSPRSSFYGVPRYVSTAYAITGTKMKAIRDVAFMKNDAPQPLDAKIHTPYGWSTMGEMQVGSDVIGSDGCAHKVTGIFPQGQRDVYRVRFSDGSSTRCTLGHLWKVSNAYDRQRDITRVMKLSEIIEGGFFYASGAAKWFVQMVSPIEYAAPAELPLDPYLLGYMLGNGWFSKDQMGVACNLKDADEIQNIITPMLPKGVMIKRRDRKLRPEYDGCGELNFRLASKSYTHNRMFQIAKELGLMGCSAREKFIPEICLRATVENRIALLQGLVDSYGCVWDTATRYVTVSRPLADGVAELVGSLGGVATIRPTKNRSTLQLTICQLPAYINPARLARKAQRYHACSTVRGKTMIGAELVGREETQCISVDADDNLYLTDDFILTHNTPRMVITVSGGRLAKDVVDRIEKFLAVEGKGVMNAARILVVEADSKQISPTIKGPEVKIEVKPITVGTNDDATFQKYRDANDGEVQEAFGLGDIFYGKGKSVNRATAEVLRKLAEEQAFGPIVVEKEYVIDQTLMRSLDLNLLGFKFKRPASLDAVEQADVDSKYASAGALTINDMRTKSLNLEPFDEPWAKMPLQVWLQGGQVNESANRVAMVNAETVEDLKMVIQQVAMLAGKRFESGNHERVRVMVNVPSL